MIGAANMQAVGDTVIIPDYAVNLSPGDIFVLTGNGSSVSPVVYSEVINGVGPLTYQWVITGNDINISSPTGPNTSFFCGGFNFRYSEVATLTVTDTGNGNAETSRNINVIFESF